jgi:hypothetical protein
MPISPERQHLAEHVRKLATQQVREEVAADLRRRADLIEAGADPGENPAEFRRRDDLAQEDAAHGSAPSSGWRKCRG